MSNLWYPNLHLKREILTSMWFGMLKGITLMNSIFLSTSFQQSLTGTSYEGDMDVGEMFLNFRLHFSERKYFKVCYTNTDAVREEVEEIT